MRRAAPLPPREDDRDRRPRRVRRRHRPHPGRRRPVRLDSITSPAATVGWHDAAVRLRGPAVADVAEHFRLRWEAATDKPLPAVEVAPAAGDVEVQVVRTVRDGVFEKLPRGDYSLLEAYCAALRSAEKLIYLENQFLWSPEIVAILADKLRNPPRDDFRIVLLLPAEANDGRGRLLRPGGGAHRGRRRRRALPRLHALRAGREPARPRVRAREDRDRRRPLADGGLGEPQLALALQRHRDERRHARPAPRARHAAPALVRAPRASRREKSTATRPSSSSATGSRSPRSSSSGSQAARR